MNPLSPRDATPLLEGMGNYDTVLVSTAPYKGDVYEPENPLQVVTKYGESMRHYVNGFLIPYLKRCLQALKEGGYLCIIILDRPDINYYITELKLLIVENLGGHYIGVIWSEGDSGNLVPWWIFMKKCKVGSTIETKRLLEPYEQEFF